MPLPYYPILDDLVPVAGRYGIVGVDPRFYRATWDNEHVEDLTDYVISGSASVTHDTSREAGNWILEASMTLDGWDRLRPFEDWIAPVWTVLYANGEYERQQLGHYLVLDAPENRDELGGTVRLDARDSLYALWSSGLRLSDVGLPQGGRIRKIREIITGALVPGGPVGATLRHSIVQPADENTSEWLGPWKDEDRRVQTINRMLMAGAYFPLYSSPTGILGIKPRAQLQAQQPLRLWYANVPNDVVPIAGEAVDLRSVYGQPSPVVGQVNTSPSTARLVDEVVVLGSLGPGGGIATEPTLGGARATAGEVRKTVPVASIANQAAAQTLAASMLEMWLAENTTVSLTVLPDPKFISIYGIVRCGVWDAQGRKVAVGKYLVKRVRYGMSVEDPLMRVELGSLEDLAPEVF